MPSPGCLLPLDPSLSLNSLAVEAGGWLSPVDRGLPRSFIPSNMRRSGIRYLLSSKPPFPRLSDLLQIRLKALHNWPFLFISTRPNRTEAHFDWPERPDLLLLVQHQYKTFSSHPFRIFQLFLSCQRCFWSAFEDATCSRILYFSANIISTGTIYTQK